VRFGWQAEATGWRGSTPLDDVHVDLLQHVAFEVTPKLPGDYDENVVIRDYGAWGAHATPPPPVEPGLSHPHKTPTLRRGDTGQYVEDLQRHLNAHGASLKVDGIFGNDTEVAVKAYQTKVFVTGVCWPTSWAK